jgi:hypothetical protein
VIEFNPTVSPSVHKIDVTPRVSVLVDGAESAPCPVPTVQATVIAGTGIPPLVTCTRTGTIDPAGAVIESTTPESSVTTYTVGGASGLLGSDGEEEDPSPEHAAALTAAAAKSTRCLIERETRVADVSPNRVEDRGARVKGV